MRFQKTIGNHMKGSGLADAWVESGLLMPNVTEYFINEKAHKRAMRVHKITLQSLAAADAFSARILPEMIPDLFQEMSILVALSKMLEH